MADLRDATLRAEDPGPWIVVCSVCRGQMTLFYQRDAPVPEHTPLGVAPYIRWVVDPDARRLPMAVLPTCPGADKSGIVVQTLAPITVDLPPGWPGLLSEDASQ